MAPNLQNVIVGLAQMWVAPFGETDAGEGEPMPADSIAQGADWGGLWLPVGGTQQGVKLSKNPKTVDITIEEQSTPVNVLIDTQDISLMTSLSEDTIANMKLAYGGGTITVQAADGSHIGKQTLVLSDTLDLLSVGFEGISPEGFWRRASFPKVVSAAQVDTEYRRAAQQRLYPTTFRVICAVGDIEIVDMVAIET